MHFGFEGFELDVDCSFIKTFQVVIAGVALTFVIIFRYLYLRSGNVKFSILCLLSAEVEAEVSAFVARSHVCFDIGCGCVHGSGCKRACMWGCVNMSACLCTVVCVHLRVCRSMHGCTVSMGVQGLESMLGCVWITCYYVLQPIRHKHREEPGGEQRGGKGMYFRSVAFLPVDPFSREMPCLPFHVNCVYE